MSAGEVVPPPTAPADVVIHSHVGHFFGPLVADGRWINCYFDGLYYNETGRRISQRERSLDWDQRPVRKRPGASYMRFSVTAPRVSGVAKRSRRVQEIVMLTLIEETPS